MIDGVQIGCKTPDVMKFGVARVVALVLVLLLGGVSEGFALFFSHCPDCRGEQTMPDDCAPSALCGCCAVRAPATAPSVVSERPPATFVLVRGESFEPVATGATSDVFHPPRS